jgi:hypothetical protein
MTRMKVDSILLVIALTMEIRRGEQIKTSRKVHRRLWRPLDVALLVHGDEQLYPWSFDQILGMVKGRAAPYSNPEMAPIEGVA